MRRLVTLIGATALVLGMAVLSTPDEDADVPAFVEAADVDGEAR